MKTLYAILTGLGILYGLYLLIGGLLWGIYYLFVGWKQLQTDNKALIAVSGFGLLLAFWPLWAGIYAVVLFLTYLIWTTQKTR